MYIGIALTGPFYELSAFAAKQPGVTSEKPEKQQKLFLGKGVWTQEKKNSRDALNLRISAPADGQPVERCLNTLSAQLGEETVEKLVICLNMGNAAEQKEAERLKTLWEKTGAVREILLADQKIAAAAFFGWQYRVRTGKDYKGTLLLAGTDSRDLGLDLIRLGKVPGSTGGVLLAEPLEQAGSSGNELRLYLTQIIAEAGGSTGRVTEGDLQRLYRLLEEQSALIRETLDEYETDCPGELDQPLGTLDCQGKKLPLTCGMLVRAYHKTMGPALDHCLKEMFRALESRNVCWQDRKSREFRLAFAGALKEDWQLNHQMEQALSFSSMDTRREGMEPAEDQKQSPVARGGALMAAGKITVGCPAPNRIDIVSRNGDGMEQRDNVRARGETMVYGKVYYPCCKGDGKRRKYLVSDKEPPQVALDGQVVRAALPARQDGKQGFRIAVAGVSLETDGTLKLHCSAYDLTAGKQTGEVQTAKLPKG